MSLREHSQYFTVLPSSLPRVHLDYVLLTEVRHSLENDVCVCVSSGANVLDAFWVSHLASLPRWSCPSRMLGGSTGTSLCHSSCFTNYPWGSAAPLHQASHPCCTSASVSSSSSWAGLALSWRLQRQAANRLDATQDRVDHRAGEKIIFYDAFLHLRSRIRYLTKSTGVCRHDE